MLLDIQVFQLDCFTMNIKALLHLSALLTILQPTRYNIRRLECLGEFLDGSINPYPNNVENRVSS